MAPLYSIRKSRGSRLFKFDPISASTVKASVMASFDEITYRSILLT